FDSLRRWGVGSGEWGEEERVQGAGGRGEEEWLLSNRKFKIISYSPLLPAPVRPCFLWGVGKSHFELY
ncbi:hypothetical protein, partial [Nodularia spumigena]|uniref:hypothetical protein n=1 Tax=Nodularia spumigena TaxID=70799 RepID=UPI0030DA2F64